MLILASAGRDFVECMPRPADPLHKHDQRLVADVKPSWTYPRRCRRFGRIPAASVRRRISLFSRCCGLLDQIGRQILAPPALPGLARVGQPSRDQSRGRSGRAPSRGTRRWEVRTGPSPMRALITRGIRAESSVSTSGTCRGSARCQTGDDLRVEAGGDVAEQRAVVAKGILRPGQLTRPGSEPHHRCTPGTPREPALTAAAAGRSPDRQPPRPGRGSPQAGWRVPGRRPRSC